MTALRRHRALSRAAVLGVAAGAALLVAGPAFAASTHGSRPASGSSADAGAVFVQTDNTSRNEVVAYRRAPGGSLTEVAAYPTGGLGGMLSGSVVDHLASQGSLTLDRSAGLLFAVNAGSNTISVFGVHGDTLRLQQVLPSGGAFPVSVTVQGGTAYVLNAEDGGSVQGYAIRFGLVVALPGSSRALGLNPAATPQFTTTPGQVAFTPGGSQLIVTTKANGDDVDVFGVLPGGYLTTHPAVNSEPGTVPFAVAFDQAGNLVIAEAGTNAVATFAVSPAGRLSELASAATGESATCWVTASQSLLFASNAGSASVTSLAVGPAGSLNLLGQTSTDAGTVDSAATPDGRFLYVQAGGNGNVDAFAVGSGGTLTEVGSVTVPGAAGGEGIVAS